MLKNEMKSSALEKRKAAIISPFFGFQTFIGAMLFYDKRSH
jgi:hypothetical protein